jgi:hypothetical protein
MRGLVGHVWTIWPHVRDKVRPPRPPLLGRPWSTTVDDPVLGTIRLTGIYHPRPGADTIAVIVHGMGGSADSTYARRTAACAEAMGVASLRVNVRGADRSGEDVSHAGQWQDLRAVLASPEVARHRRVVVAGYSLGGHTALRLATEDPGPVSAVAAICAPVDLAASCAHIDSGRTTRIYRAHLLRGLRDIYRTVALRRPMPLSERELRAIRSVRQWDQRVIVPRFGFASAEAYYAEHSVASRLPDLQVRALYVGAEGDPMVAAATVRPALERASARLSVRWMPVAGHVGFPVASGLERAVLEWLLEIRS